MPQNVQIKNVANFFSSIHALVFFHVYLPNPMTGCVPLAMPIPRGKVADTLAPATPNPPLAPTAK